MGYLGEEIKKFGFGLMRLPMKDNEIDVEQVKQMVDRFMESGFTYFDTAYGYHDGKSEVVAKEALVDRYPRESFQLATKLPAWYGAKNAEEARQMFYTSLERTGAGYFDFYLLHNIGDNRISIFEEYDLWNFVKELKEKGLIKHYGFSFHDKAEVLDEVLTKHPDAEFVQLQINYADWESVNVQSKACYEVARKHNKPVIIMEPVKGGSLSALPDSIGQPMKDYAPDASYSSWALRYAASLPGLITVLSGMSNMEQMEDNLSFMKDMKPLCEEEQKIIKEVQDRLSAVPQVPCTTCRYCTKGCPANVNIPGTFRSMNLLTVFGYETGAVGTYKWEMRNGGYPENCIECGQCEEVCPQHIEIIKELKRGVELFKNK